jgi:hypothetical protein
MLRVRAEARTLQSRFDAEVLTFKADVILKPVLFKADLMLKAVGKADLMRTGYCKSPSRAPWGIIASMKYLRPCPPFPAAPGGVRV